MTLENGIQKTLVKMIVNLYTIFLRFTHNIQVESGPIWRDMSIISIL